jgi:hypothetical protein
MAKINSKIDKALRKEVIENGVFLGHIASFGFNCNVYLYKNEVYREDFTINDDFIITDFARWTWYMVKSNITQFHPNEPYAEELIEYMTLYEHSLYLSNKKYREIAKEQFAELKKDYQESGLLDDINALLKKSKSKTFRYSKYESKKSARKSIKESKNSSILDDELYDLIEQGYIYDEDENGMNMSYGEYVAVSDDLWETLENELEYYRDFPSAYDAYNEIMDNTSDDAKMFMGVSDDDYFYFEINEDENTYNFSGEVPTVLEKLFKKFLKETDFERV